jgi:peroxiredoxin
MFKKLTLPSLSVLSWVVVVILTLSNVLLIRQNGQLRAVLGELEAEQKIQVGDKLAPFRAAGLDGQSVEVRFGENEVKKVVLFSSITCPFCKKQNPGWNQLIHQIDRQKYEVLEVFRNRERPSQIAAYLRVNSPDGDSAKVLLTTDEFLQRAKLNTTPITLVVGRNGVVEKAWFGLWNDFSTAEVNSFLGTSIQLH